jgi:hypothetical protein
VNINFNIRLKLIKNYFLNLSALFLIIISTTLLLLPNSHIQAAEIGWFKQFLNKCTTALIGGPTQEVGFIEPQEVKSLFLTVAEENLTRIIELEGRSAFHLKPFLRDTDLSDLGSKIMNVILNQNLELKKDTPKGGISLGQDFPFYSEINKALSQVGIRTSNYTSGVIPFWHVDMLDLIDIHLLSKPFVRGDLSPFKLSFLSSSGSPVFVYPLGNTNDFESALNLYLKLTYFYANMYGDKSVKGITINEKGEYFAVLNPKTAVVPFENIQNFPKWQILMDTLEFLDRSDVSLPYMVVRSQHQKLLEAITSHLSLADQELAKILEVHLPKLPFMFEPGTNSVFIYTANLGIDTSVPLVRSNPSQSTGYVTLLLFKLVLILDPNQQIRLVKNLTEGRVISQEALIEFLAIIFKSGAHLRAPLANLNSPDLIKFVDSFNKKQ